MNRFNFGAQAVQAVSTVSAIASITEGNRRQAKALQQQKKFTTDKVVIEEAREVAEATRGGISETEYAQKNTKAISSDIDTYATMYGESNAEAGYKLNKGARTEQGINTKENAIRSYAQQNVNEYKAKSSQPTLDTNGVLDLMSRPAEPTTDNKEVE